MAYISKPRKQKEGGGRKQESNHRSVVKVNQKRTQVCFQLSWLQIISQVNKLSAFFEKKKKKEDRKKAEEVE